MIKMPSRYVYILLTMALAFWYAIILPHYEKGNEKVLPQLFDKKNLDQDTPRGQNVGLACAVTRYPSLCKFSLSSNAAISADPDAENIVKAAIEIASKRDKEIHTFAYELLQISNDNASFRAVASQCEYLLRRNILLFSKCLTTSFTVRITDVQAWMSAILTYENDCHSALSYVNWTHIVHTIMEHSDTSITLTSIALSIVNAYSIYGSDLNKWTPPYKSSSIIVNSKPKGLINHHLLEKIHTNYAPSVVVSQDGQGTYTTIQAAVDDAPENSTKRHIIYIKEGIYNEIVRIPFTKTCIMFIGDGKNKTVITGSRNAQMVGVTTYGSATVAVDGDGFIARDMTFVNTAGPYLHQAVALRVDSDFSVFLGCSIVGFQDTLYAHSLRQFYQNCEIQGTIDFVFGNSAAVFQNCTILIRPGRLTASKSVVSAQGRTDPAQATGFAFRNCRIGATDEYVKLFNANPKKLRVYLGRPWKLYSRTVFLNSFLDGIIRPEGWLPWRGDFALSTLYYGECRNYGPGSNITERVPWSTQISQTQASVFSPSSFIQGDHWLPSVMSFLRVEN